jgi:hypothetical protein
MLGSPERRGLGRVSRRAASGWAADGVWAPDTVVPAATAKAGAVTAGRVAEARRKRRRDRLEPGMAPPAAGSGEVFMGLSFAQALFTTQRRDTNYIITDDAIYVKRNALNPSDPRRERTARVVAV